MGRSVSYPHNAVAVTYRELDTDESVDEFIAQENWDDLVDWIRETAQKQWSSFSLCDTWLDKEDHAILENGHAYLGVSEYVGIVSVWLVPKDDRYGNYQPLAHCWCEQIADKFKKTFGTFNRIGTFDNGESVYERSSS